MDKKIPYGYCHCGCGQKTKIAIRNFKKRGWIKGDPVKFIQGHHAKMQGTMEKSVHWKGGRYISNKGYVLMYQPNHPRASNGYISEHIVIAEKAIGKPLPEKAVIHHVNEDRKFNINQNLVICEDKTYHALLHKRLKALKECGNADWVRCWICKKYDAVENLVPNVKGNQYHKECCRKYSSEKYHRQKLKRMEGITT